MDIKVSRYKIAASEDSVEQAGGGEVVRLSVKDLDWRERPALQRLLEKDFARERCAGIQAKHVERKEDATPFMINGHTVGGYPWGWICRNRNCEKRVAVDSLLGFIPSGLPRSEGVEDPLRLNGDESGTPSFDHTIFYGTQGIRLAPVDTSRLAARSFIVAHVAEFGWEFSGFSHCGAKMHNISPNTDTCQGAF